MAEAVVSLVVERLGDLLISEAKHLHGVRGRVERIKIELNQMQSLLKDADARQDESETLHGLVAEIRELAYRVEDVVDCYAAEVESRRESGIRKFLKRMAGFHKEGIALLKVGKELESIQSEISDITRRLEICGINRQAAESSSSGNLRGQRLSQPEYVEQDFVGMEDYIKKLVSSLADKDVRVVSIWGMEGLGKTTLALKVYNHYAVQRCFDAFAWVCVTQKSQTRKMLQDVLKQLSSNKEDRIAVKGLLSEKKDPTAQMSDGELLEGIYRVQTQKKCLVVLDDIWSTDAWNSMRRAFPDKNRSGSKILLTTRNRDVTVHVDPDGFHYQLQLLDDEQSWELLKKKIFTKNDGSDTSISEGKEELGRKMVKHCQGLPLAIAVLGGLLKREDWHVVNQNIMKHLRKGSNFGKQGELPQVLALSYNELPYQLKPCFLYLGGFPEGSEIQAEKLYQLWIAEGLVLSKDREDGETMMDVAERYLGELAQRSMVQIQLVEVPAIRRFQSCRLHDLMRDLCLRKAREENFLELMDDLNQNQTEHGPNFLTRLAIDLALGNVGRYVALPKEPTLHLRALLLHLSVDGDLSVDGKDKFPEIIEQFCRFKMLKVLAIEDNFDEYKSSLQFPEPISKLIHLRYFCIGGAWDELPSSIGKLQHLQTLNLETCYFFYAPREDILKNMGQLRHLYLPQIYNRRLSKGKLRFDGLGNLETLVGFNTSWCEAKDLIKLINLRELGAAVESDFDHFAEITKYVSSSNNLKQFGLTIRGINFGSEEMYSDLGGKLLGSASLYSLKTEEGNLKLPKHDVNQSLSPSLLYIDLSFTVLEEGSIAVLERFPQLQILYLRGDSYVEKVMVCSATGFPQLRRFWLETSELEMWIIEEGAMLHLSELIIDGCSKLKMLPDGLRCIASLHVLRIYSMPNEFKRRVKVVDGQKGEDFDRIKHVPTIEFGWFESSDEEEPVEKESVEESDEEQTRMKVKKNLLKKNLLKNPLL